MEQVRRFCIPYSKQRWASAVELLNHDNIATEQEGKVGNCHIVFGERKGSIHLFDARGRSQHEVIQSLERSLLKYHKGLYLWYLIDFYFMIRS